MTDQKVGAWFKGQVHAAGRLFRKRAAADLAGNYDKADGRGRQPE
jgi:hypothetical protein